MLLIDIAVGKNTRKKKSTTVLSGKTNATHPHAHTVMWVTISERLFWLYFSPRALSFHSTVNKHRYIMYYRVLDEGRKYNCKDNPVVEKQPSIPKTLRIRPLSFCTKAVDQI